MVGSLGKLFRGWSTTRRGLNYHHDEMAGRCCSAAIIRILSTSL